MIEISKYEIELFLNQHSLLLIDAYIDKKDLILEVEKTYATDIDEDMFIAEMEINFEQFSNITYDSEFENFLIQIDSKEGVQLID